MAKIRLAGALIHILKIIWYEFCTLVTSVVSLVTRPAVLNLSILEKRMSVYCYTYLLSDFGKSRRSFGSVFATHKSCKKSYKSGNKHNASDYKDMSHIAFSIPSSTRDAIR